MEVDVTFQLYEGVTNTITVSYGGVVHAPDDPTRAGYVFAGWAGEDGSTFDFSAPLYTATTIKATWIARTDIPYQVEHYWQDVTGSGYTLHETEDSLTGTTDTQATAIPKEYAGFQERTDHPDRVAAGTVSADGALTLKLYYDREICTITFEPDNGGGSSSVSLRYGNVVTQPLQDPQREGYAFVAWQRDGADYDFSSQVTEDITLTAFWTPRTDTPYKVEHYWQDVIGDGYTLYETEDGLMGTTDAQVTAAAKNYTGFHERADHPDRVATGAVSADGALTLKLYYDREVFTVSLDADSGAAPVLETLRYGDVVTKPENPQRDGYTFVAWQADGADYDFSAPVTGNVVLIPKWVALTDIPYKIEHYLQTKDKTGYVLQEDDTDELTGTTDTEVTAVAKEYAGYHVAEDHAELMATGTIAGDGSLVLKLFYDWDIYQITVDLNNGKEPITLEIQYGDTLERPEDPSKPGFTFEGWLDGNGDPYDFTQPVTGPVELVPVWKEIPRPSTSRPVTNSKYDLEAPQTYLKSYADSEISRAQAAHVFAAWLKAQMKDETVTTVFADVSQETEHGIDITWVNDKGVEIGYGDGCFGPDDNLTREQLALMLYRVCGTEKQADLTAGYQDEADVADWSYEAVSWAVHMGLLKDIGGELRPQGAVTGAELTTALVKAAKLK